MRNKNIGSDAVLFDINSDQTNEIAVPFYFEKEQDAISGAGAVSVTVYYTELTSTSTDAWTLADGLVTGQVKKVFFLVDGGTSTLTLTSPVSSSLDVITFTDIGQFAKLIWNGTAWVILERGATALGGTPAVG